MPDIRSIDAVAVDIAGRTGDAAKQEELADFIWHLIERSYQVFLFSTSPRDDVSRYDFQHPRLTYLTRPLPPKEGMAPESVRLLSPKTLWVSDDGAVQEWLVRRGLPGAYVTRRDEAHDPGLRVVALSELAALLEPTRHVIGELVETIAARRRGMTRKSLLVGVGGPLLSGFEAFALELKGELELAGHPLVELLDLSPFLHASDDESAPPPQPGFWRERRAAEWLLKDVLGPIHAGRQVYVERLPPEAPAAFAAHLPLYLSEESVVLAFAETLFVPEVRALLDLSILLDVSPKETTRRLYEMPDDEEFDPKFVDQYLAHDGKAYGEYLRACRVGEHVDVRIDANRRKAFALADQGRPLV